MSYKQTIKQQILIGIVALWAVPFSFADEQVANKTVTSDVVDAIEAVQSTDAKSQNNSPTDKAKTAVDGEPGKTGLGEEVFALGDQPDGSSLMQEGVKTIIMLLILLVGFWWFSNWLKRSGKLAKITGGNGGIECLSVYSVGQKEKIALIRVRGEDLLVGITQHAIQPLHHFKDHNSGGVPELTVDKDAPSDAEFSKLLDSASENT